MAENPLIMVTTPYIPGYRIDRILGPTWGTVVRSRGVGYQLTAFVRSLGGGEIHEYTSMLNDARARSLQRLEEHARALGANAVVGMSFDSSEMGQNLSEVLAYGTAVWVTADDETPKPVRLV
jgi:uncharacterized protein YbjQ (UPF0145 family)